MALDPQAKAFWDFLKSLGGVPVHALSPEKNRAGINYLVKKAGMAPQPVAEVKEQVIPVEDGKISLRIYLPEGPGPFPVLVFFHGGGWVMGGLDIVDSPLRAITNAAQCLVVSVAYRLAPEHKFPVALNDCYLATRWAAENAHYFKGDGRRIAVGGESAGGNLAACTCLMARDRGLPSLSFQVLLYPVTDLSGRDYPSRSKFNGIFLSMDDMKYYENHYLAQGEDRENSYLSPVLAGNLSGLPPALVVTAGNDPLHDEGEAYAKRLKEAGVDVDYHCFEDMIHAFFLFGGMMEKANKALVELIARSLKKAFAR